MELKNKLHVFFRLFILLCTFCLTTVSSSAMYTPDGRFLFGGYGSEDETNLPNTPAEYGECVLEQSNMPISMNLPSSSICNMNNCQNTGFLKAGSTTLPVGSTAYITNTENKRVVEVVISHEGPINPRVVGRIAELPVETFCCIAGIDQKVFPCYVSTRT